MPAAVRRTYSGVVDYSGTAREHTVVISQSGQIDLLDVELMFFALPSLNPPTASALLTGAKNIRLYLNEHDITASLADELKLEFRQSLPVWRFQACFGPDPLRLR